MNWLPNPNPGAGKETMTNVIQEWFRGCLLVIGYPANWPLLAIFKFFDFNWSYIHS